MKKYDYMEPPIKALMDEHLRALGAVTVACAHFEDTVNRCIDMHLPQTGEVIRTIILSLPSRIQVLESLFRQNAPDPEFQKFQPVMEQARRLPILRNNLIHSVWSYEEHEGKVTAIYHPKAKQQHTGLQPVSAKELEEFSDEVMEVSKKLYEFAFDNLPLPPISPRQD